MNTNVTLERFYKETCGAIYHCITKYGDKTLTDWQRWSLNESFKFDLSLDYSIKTDGNKMMLENEKVRIEYFNDIELRNRTVRIACVS